MMIYTVKFSKKKAVAILLAMAIVIAAIILAVPEKTEAELPAAAVLRVRTEDERLAYIRSLGYQAGGEPLEQKEVVIPETFDAVYTEYNLLQQSCGFDLEDYKGEAVTLYTYGLVDYPAEGEVRCDLLVCRNRIIGGNIYTTAIDGFMHGLQARSS